MMQFCALLSLSTLVAHLLVMQTAPAPALTATNAPAERPTMQKPVAATKAPATIELVICLDTSGSMNGLLNAARTKIWGIVSDLAQATPQPKLRVALLTFGNLGHLQENGWTNIDVDFTDNLDLVSDRLFGLTTNGGDEYVGRVIDRATNGLSWGSEESSLRMLVVAGNESADQDQQIRYVDACKRAIEKSIVVNSIYCGSPDDAIAPGWQDVARKADGHFAAIDQDNGTVVIATPFDAELASLSSAINATYLPFGSAGGENATMQWRQDENAAKSNSAAAADRCVTKATALYQCGAWDLVDACASPGFSLDSVKPEELPEAMRPMTAEERRAHVAAKGAERAALRTKVTEIAAKREAFLVEEAARLAKESGTTGAQGFDRAIRDAIRAQASARGFTFPENPVAAAPTEKSAPSPSETTKAAG